MIHQSLVLTVFYAWRHIYCVLKIFGTTFLCVVVIQLQGDCPKMYTNDMYYQAMCLPRSRFSQVSETQDRATVVNME